MLSEQGGTCMSSPSNSTNPTFPHNLAHHKIFNKLTGYSVVLWHMLCSPFNRVDLVPCIAQEVAKPKSRLTMLEQHMSDLTKQYNFLPRTRVTETARKPLHLTAIITGLLLSIMPFYYWMRHRRER